MRFHALCSCACARAEGWRGVDRYPLLEARVGCCEATLAPTPGSFAAPSRRSHPHAVTESSCARESHDAGKKVLKPRTCPQRRAWTQKMVPACAKAGVRLRQWLRRKAEVAALVVTRTTAATARPPRPQRSPQTARDGRANDAAAAIHRLRGNSSVHWRESPRYEAGQRLAYDPSAARRMTIQHPRDRAPNHTGSPPEYPMRPPTHKHPLRLAARYARRRARCVTISTISSP